MAEFSFFRRMFGRRVTVGPLTRLGNSLMHAHALYRRSTLLLEGDDCSTLKYGGHQKPRSSCTGPHRSSRVRRWISPRLQGDWPSLPRLSLRQRRDTGPKRLPSRRHSREVDTSKREMPKAGGRVATVNRHGKAYSTGTDTEKKPNIARHLPRCWVR